VTVTHKRIKQALAVGATAAFGIGATTGTASAAPPFNVIVGTLGPDLLIGTQQNDWIVGRAGNDELVGRRGDDVLLGRRGNDVLRAAAPGGSGQNDSGADILRGGRGNDRCIGDSSDRFSRTCETIIRRGG
jgi:Ca2+-binding RTX toxin-like protein